MIRSCPEDSEKSLGGNFPAEWIYGDALMRGKYGFPKDADAGLAHIRNAAGHGVLPAKTYLERKHADEVTGHIAAMLDSIRRPYTSDFVLKSLADLDTVPINDKNATLLRGRLNAETVVVAALQMQLAPSPDRKFRLGRTEVTQAQYEEIMRDNPGDPKGANLPVNGVTWNEATTFCEKLTERERIARRLPADYAFRLPTQAEYADIMNAVVVPALKSGGLGDYAWFVGSPDYQKNFWGTEYFAGYVGGNSGEHPHDVATLHPTGAFYDLLGNVREWCDDPGSARHAVVGGGYMSSTGECVAPAGLFETRIQDGGARDTGHLVRHDGDDEEHYQRFRTTGFRVVLAKTNGADGIHAGPDSGGPTRSSPPAPVE